MESKLQDDSSVSSEPVVAEQNLFANLPHSQVLDGQEEGGVLLTYYGVRDYLSQSEPTTVDEILSTTE